MARQTVLFVAAAAAAAAAVATAAIAPATALPAGARADAPLPPALADVAARQVPSPTPDDDHDGHGHGGGGHTDDGPAFGAPVPAVHAPDHDHDGGAHDAGAHDVDATCTSEACRRNWKIVFAAVLFFEGVFGSLVPFGLKYLPRFDVALHMANAFSGGIFVATGMLHVLPEALALAAGHAHEGETHDAHAGEGGEEEGGFPTVYALALASFFAILFVEHIVLRKYSHAHGHAALAEVVAEKGGTELAAVGGGDAKGALRPRAAAAGGDRDSWDHVDGAGSPDALKAELADEARLAAGAPGGRRLRDAAGAVGGATVGGRPGFASYALETSFEVRRQTLAAANEGFFSANFFRALLAIVAVSLHSMFESLSLGLASDFASALNICIAIACHKWATSIALGVKCEKEELRWGQYLSLILLFAAVTPATVGVGMALSGVSTTVRGVLFALSAGIFLFIGAFEVPAEEFMVHTRWLWGKFFAYGGGAAVITGITAVLIATGIH
ncbi:hypothetical protein BU14_0445s0027 [Porphyra umbilicalis]|uniref:Uncharacterized protein n=1 Tax=Porphyra umbilicalis TaxID=2786 RepID=A0A1X6NUV6_PORUM|nr:hypothetical protein BU14_0445s0027 [Porphyra umbilicalis]|eukprot:OSX72345.1 hypothetical protein BU14_0445s0027 [Porphyra umbilicalis]